jgi:hypothetical protein
MRKTHSLNQSNGLIKKVMTQSIERRLGFVISNGYSLAGLASASLTSILKHLYLLVQVQVWYFYGKLGKFIMFL